MSEGDVILLAGLACICLLGLAAWAANGPSRRHLIGRHPSPHPLTGTTLPITLITQAVYWSPSTRHWWMVPQRNSLAHYRWIKAHVDAIRILDAHAALNPVLENQHFADERIPILLDTPAAVRFISAEPLLGPLGLRPYLDGYDWTDLLGWVIVGGESGPRARPCDLAWVRSILNQCSDAGVPCFVKQLGTNVFDGERDSCHMFRDRKGGDPAEWPTDLRVRDFPEAR